MFGASSEAAKAGKLIQEAIDAKHKSIVDQYRALYPFSKTQEEIDIDDAMAELDKEFPPLVDNKTGG